MYYNSNNNIFNQINSGFTLNPKPKSNSPSNQEYEFYNEEQLKPGLNTSWNPVDEDKHISQFVTFVYYTMYPLKNNYPNHWKTQVLDFYKRIRQQRAIIRKSSSKNGMKGLRLQIVVGAILYCILIKQNIVIPIPFFVKILNNALKRYHTKIDKNPINLQTYERYRTNNKIKGIYIKPLISELLPKCYHDVQPEDMIEFIGFSYLGLNRQLVYKAKRIAKYSKTFFDDIVPHSYIAISALYITVSLSNPTHMFDHNFFGISKFKLESGVNTIIKALPLSKKLQEDIPQHIKNIYNLTSHSASIPVIPTSSPPVLQFTSKPKSKTTSKSKSKTTSKSKPKS